MKLPSIEEMLSYCRPAWSPAEEAFIERFIDPIPDIYSDGFGNRLLVNPDSDVIISCHTDTVHRSSGRQRPYIAHGYASLPRGSKSNCLGADCTAGVYAALRMIHAKVPATFIFHRAEEIGGQGSDWLATHYPDWLSSHRICLALDRRGTSDIIIEQFVGPTASNSFAQSLANALDMFHSPARGTFTDSANYAHLISECSNLSIGYQNEHTRFEYLNLDYLERLVDRLCSIDFSQVHSHRDPFAPPPSAKFDSPLSWPDFLDSLDDVV
jgi:hypothetical protein